METRFALRKIGTVNEDESITDTTTIHTSKNVDELEEFAAKSKQCSDGYYITEQEFDGLYWLDIEGTEDYF